MTRNSHPHVLLEANDAVECLNRLRAIDIRVPPRGDGRCSWHCEKRTAYRLVATLVSERVWSGSIRIVKRERPDFVASVGGKTIGVEFTEVTQEDFVATTMLPEARGEVCVVDRSLFRVGASKSPAERRRIARQGRLTGPGWPGDEPEREWALAVQQTLERKSRKLSSYERFDEDLLLLYENMMLPGVDAARATGLLSIALAAYWRSDGFRIIAIDTEDAFWLLTQTGSRRLPVANLRGSDAGAQPPRDRT